MSPMSPRADPNVPTVLFNSKCYPKGRTGRHKVNRFTKVTVPPNEAFE